MKYIVTILVLSFVVAADAANLPVVNFNSAFSLRGEIPMSLGNSVIWKPHNAITNGLFYNTFNDSDYQLSVVTGNDDYAHMVFRTTPTAAPSFFLDLNPGETFFIAPASATPALYITQAGAVGGNFSAATNMNATELRSGTVAVARMPTNEFGIFSYGVGSSYQPTTALNFHNVTNYSRVVAIGGGSANANGNYTNSTAGWYEITWTQSIEADSANSDVYYWQVVTNGVAVSGTFQQFSLFSTDIYASTDTAVVGNSTIVYLPANCGVSVQNKCGSAGRNPTIYGQTFSVKRQ